MGRLSQLLRRVTATEAPPLGFGVTAHRPRATMLLLARVAGDASSLPGHLSKGAADALLVEAEVAGRLAKELRDLGDLPWGALVPAAAGGGIEALREAGADFLVFDPARSEASVLLEEGMDLVAVADPEASDTDLRLLESLPLAALLAPAPSLPLTVGGRLALQRLSALSRLPLLIPVPAGADGALLRLLRDAGAAAVVVDGATGADALAALREAIEKLPPRARRREERLEPLVPSSLLPRPGGGEEEEEEALRGRSSAPLDAGASTRPSGRSDGPAASSP
jgi:hypothetical protein